MKEVTSDNEKVSTLDRIVDEQRPAMERYQEITLGKEGLLFLLRYELAMILCNGLSGAVGLWLRKKLYPGLFGKVGTGVVFGKNISLRHPGRIEIGDGTIVDDCCVLDARAEADISISIGSNTFVARDTIIACKGGNIQIGDRVGIGARTTIHSYVGNEVEIGNKVLIGPYCYIVGAGLYNTEETDVPIADQGILLKGGVKIGDNAWLGARATIIDGVIVGNDSIVAAGAVVTRDVPPFSVVAGVPARVIKDRKESA